LVELLFLGFSTGSLALQTMRKTMTKNITALSSVLTIALTGLFLFTTATPVIASSNCEPLKGCERKFCEIERQLKISKEKGNERKTDGLRISLNNAKKNCTNKGLKDDLVEEISSINEEVAEYETDLKEAEKHRKTDKTRKYQNKIEEEKSKIKFLEDELSRID